MTNKDANIRIRPLLESDLATADHVMRVAFGTFIGLAEPAAFMGDGAYVRSRWRTDPDAAFAAELADEVVGSNFATNWGSVGFFGPLTVRPDLWDRGIAKRLMEPVMDCFARWQSKHTGLFTFPQSQKHVALYQKFGFWPRFLTAVMSKSVETIHAESTHSLFSTHRPNDTNSLLVECRNLTNHIFDGLDVTREIRSVADQGLGDTVLLWHDSKLVGLAVCHCGAGTEAGGGACYLKFGAVRPDSHAERWFEQLLVAAEHLARTRRMSRLVAGANTARHEAYRMMLARGFRTDIQGVSMHRPNADGYSRPGFFVIDDWR